MAEIIFTDNYRIGEREREIEVRAEGSDEFAGKQAAAIMEILQNRAACASPCHCQPGREVGVWEPGKEEQKVGRTVITEGLARDVVVIYDNAGIPSIMHRFRRMTDRELFDGSDKVHPAFVIGGEIYDEIFISVYENTMINGKPYSLPYSRPETNITMEEFAQACFQKGEGWHCLTAAEWGLLANISLKNGTLPHGNTCRGEYHADKSEHGTTYDDNRTLTGSGPKTWTHDHTETGVHDLCGNIWEFCRGMRIKDGILYMAKNNDAALPETDLSENGDGWKAIRDDEGRFICISVSEDEIRFTTDNDTSNGYTGCRWEDVKMDCKSEKLKELAFYCGEPEAYCYVDSTEGEYILIRGGYWDDGANAGVFFSYLGSPRSDSNGSIGGRSAYFRKHRTQVTETPNVER